MTACAPNDRILQTLRAHTPGATDQIIELELFNVMDEFFRRTSAWRLDHAIDLVEGQIEYGFATPIDATVVRVLGVTHNDMPLQAASTGNLIQSSLGVLPPGETFPDGDAEFFYVQSDINVSNLYTYAIYRPEFISIITEPDEQARRYPLKVTTVLSVSRSCLDCDCGNWPVEDWLWDMYFQDWLDGSLHKLYSMPAKPWSNKELAVHHGKRFRNEMAYRKQEAFRGFVWNAPPPWRFPRGWGS